MPAINTRRNSKVDMRKRDAAAKMKSRDRHERLEKLWTEMGKWYVFRESVPPRDPEDVSLFDAIAVHVDHLGGLPDP